jgi:hypothetical protein
MKERHDNVQNARRDLSQVLADANPDVVIVISNLHGNIPEHAQQTFGVYIGDSIPKNERREDAAQAGRTPNEGANGGDSYATDVRLATHVHTNLRESGFDIACSHDFPSSSGIGDAFTSLYPLFSPDNELPMVPFMISRYYPNEPSSARSYQLGKALRGAIESWGEDKRVAVMASGGLSHQIVDEQLDRRIVKGLVERDVTSLTTLPRDRLNGAPGTPESLNWVALAGLMDPLPMTLLAYEPCYRSRAGTGHGVTLGYWQ